MSCKVKILLPYYGQWPGHFPEYLEGCRHNPWADFHFFTDLALPSPLPGNVAFTRMTLADLLSLVRVKTGVGVPASIRPLKLCDYRPMYGVVFSDDLQGYDFWGFGDIDVIYGKISDFITAGLLENYDVISCRKKWVSGSLSLFRNVPRVNGLYRGSPCYRTVLETGEHLGFDECLGNYYDKLIHGASIFELDKKGSFTRVIRESEARGEIKTSFQNIAKESPIKEFEHLVWDRGSLRSGSGVPVAYFHFICNKGRDGFFIPRWNERQSRFYITSTGFYVESEFKSSRYPFLVCSRKIAGGIKRMKRIPRRLRRMLSHAADD